MRGNKRFKIIGMVVIAMGVLAGTYKINIYAADSTEPVVNTFSWSEEGVYPISPGDGMWEELSYKQQLEAISMPEEKLNDCTSEELAEWVLEYPFLLDVLAFDTAEQAIYHFTQTSNILNEFFSREDSVSVLLKEYSDLYVDYELLSNSSVQNSLLDSGYAKELFLQTFFAGKFEQLTDNEKDELKYILQEKYIDKIGICDNYSTALLFYDFVQDKYGVIPKNIVPEIISSLEIFQTEPIEVEEFDYSAVPLTNSGFSSSGLTIVATNGATYYLGTYTLYGETVECYKYISGDYTTTEKNSIDASYASAHSSWTKVFSATKKYNCHSYAWIDASQSNVYWLDNPGTFAGSSSFTYICKNGSAASGDHIIITDTKGLLAHSMIACSNGTNSNSIKTTSKLGNAGVYDAPLVDMMILYSGSYYEVYR